VSLALSLCLSFLCVPGQVISQGLFPPPPICKIEAQAGIKIAGRNINNLIYADDTTLMAESEEDLKSLLMKVKEESEKVAQHLEN